MSLYKGSQLISGAIPNSANQSLSNLDSAGQDKFDAKVNKSGDTMTGDLIIQGGQGALQIEADNWGSLILKNSNIDTTVAPIENQFMGIDFRDKNDIRIGFLGVKQTAGSADTIMEFQIRNSKDFVFNHSSKVDGQWVKSDSTLASGLAVSQTTDKVFSLSSYLPSDGQNYMVLVTGFGRTDATSGHYNALFLKSSLADAVQLFQNRARTSATVDSGGSAWMPIGTNRQLIVMHQGSTNYSGFYTLYLRGYRRIGSNS